MPSVGSKKFAYSPGGKSAAKAFAKKTGQSVKDNPRDSAATERAERKRGIKT